MERVYIVFKNNTSTGATSLHDMFLIEEYAKRSVDKIMSSKRLGNTVAFYQEHTENGEKIYKKVGR